MRRKFSSKTFFAAVLVFTTSVPFGGTLVAYAYTNPGKPAGFVNDFAEMLSAQERGALEAKLTAFEQSTSNELTIATISSLEGNTIENVAVKLFEDWKIGKKKNDNGVLLLIARDEREVRIEVGYGLEGALTDAQSHWIIQNQIIPAFKSAQYAAGIGAAADVIIAATKGEYVPSGTENHVPRGRINYQTFFYLFIFGFVWLGSILARSKSWWGGGVVGGIAGVIVGFLKGFMFLGIIALAILIPLGLFFDFFVSRTYEKSKRAGVHPPWWIGGGGGHGGFGGGGFGGFGGGGSGGGGASGKW